MGEEVLIVFLVIGFIILLAISTWLRTPSPAQSRIDPAKAQDKSLKLVTVAIFDNAIEAHFAKTRLENEDIECFIEDEFVPVMEWWYWHAVGGVKLKVRESAAQRAKEILNEKITTSEAEAEPDAAKTGEELHCPKCNSTSVYYIKTNRRAGLISAFFGLPIPFPKRKWQCKSCKYEWKNPSNPPAVRMKYNPPEDQELFFAWLKQTSEKYWENIQINNKIYGFQIQPQTKWKPGLSDIEISKFESEMGFQFPIVLKLFYKNMNGTDKPAIDVYGQSGEKYAYSPIFYSYPDDLPIIKDYINWIYEEFKINEDYIKSNGISHIFPVYSHRFIMIEHEKNPVLSMYGNDVIFYAPSLRHLLYKDIFNEPIAHKEKDVYVKFWLDNL